MLDKNTSNEVFYRYFFRVRFDQNYTDLIKFIRSTWIQYTLNARPSMMLIYSNNCDIEWVI